MFAAATLALACLAFVEPPQPIVSIIIDDIGYNMAVGETAISLPGPYALAVLPFSPYAARLAALAEHEKKDVIIHLPMEAHTSNHLLGQGAITISMTQPDVQRSVTNAVAAVPNAVGLNNHMGSRMTQSRKHMKWLATTLREFPPLFFVDSRTIGNSVAGPLIQAAGIRTVSRKIFLDSVDDSPSVSEQLLSLVEDAKRNGHSLAIGHPYPQTLRALKNWVPSDYGVTLVGLEKYVESVMSGLAGSTTSNRECADDAQHARATQ